MKRYAVIAAWGLILIALAPAAHALDPVISPIPGSGPGGTEVNVIGSGFLPGVSIEIHEGTKGGTLLGAGTTSGGGLFGIAVTIPSGAPLGTYTLYACGSCASEFYDEATTTFQVTAPPTTSTSTTTTTTSTLPSTVDDPPEPAAAEPCEIPDDAYVIDFEAWPRGDEPWQGRYGLMQHNGIPSLISARPDSTGTGWTDVSYEFVEEPVYAETYIGVVDPLGLTTSSPDRFAGIIGPGQFRLIVADPDDPAQSDLHHLYGADAPAFGHIDYFGFNVGFGAAERNLPAVDEIEVRLSVHLVPFRNLATGALVENDWGTVRAYLGVGAQPVTKCLMISDPNGIRGPIGTYIIELEARTLEGDPLHEWAAFEIDDVFFGVDEDPMTASADSPIPEDDDEVVVVATLPDIGEPPPDPSDLPARLVFLGAGLLLGVGGVMAWRRFGIGEAGGPPG